MESYCIAAIHQLELAVNSTAALISSIEESDWNVRPTEGKFSIGELVGHIALICEADRRIANGASKPELSAFYAASTPHSTIEAQARLKRNFDSFKTEYLPLTAQQLQEPRTSYWGVTYSRYEWLLETLVHLIHHRGQLHAMLVHGLGKNPDIAFFE